MNTVGQFSLLITTDQLPLQVGLDLLTSVYLGGF